MRRDIYIAISLTGVLLVILAIFQHYYKEESVKPFSKKKYVLFDESMQLQKFPSLLKRSDFSYVYTFFKNLYEDNSFQKITPSDSPRIPKIIHIMWLGGKLPEQYRLYVQSWRVHHPDWSILFWTDNAMNYDQGSEILYSFDDLEHRLATVKKAALVVDMSTIQFANRCFYDNATNYGERSDILKWEIVYRFGGVYVDTDFECLHPLDIYHHTYDFYTGIQPLDTNMVQLGAALYGATPYHPILKDCVETIKNNQHINQIIVKTGPIHFTKTFLNRAGKTGLRDIALPSSYFYPCGYEERGSSPNKWCKAESSAVHHWAGSWLLPEAFIHS